MRQTPSPSKRADASRLNSYTVGALVASLAVIPVTVLLLAAPVPTLGLLTAGFVTYYYRKNSESKSGQQSTKTADRSKIKTKAKTGPSTADRKETDNTPDSVAPASQ